MTVEGRKLTKSGVSFHQYPVMGPEGLVSANAVLMSAIGKYSRAPSRTLNTRGPCFGTRRGPWQNKKNKASP